MAQWVKCPTLGFGSGHDLPVRELEPHIRLCTDSFLSKGRAGGFPTALPGGAGPAGVRISFVRYMGGPGSVHMVTSYWPICSFQLRAVFRRWAPFTLAAVPVIGVRPKFHKLGGLA